MQEKKHLKVSKFVIIFSGILLSVLFFFGFLQRPIYSAYTINLQGKIVRNDTGYEGLNVSAGSPACVVDGAANDTCDFRIRYYNASSAGTLLLTEVFSNVEIGQYKGVFNLSLGSDPSPTAGSYSSVDALIQAENTVYVEIGFDPAGGNSYTETFTRMSVQATAYAVRSKYSDSAGAASEMAFSGLTSGTNTQAAMVVGAGASLDYTSTGTINASSLLGSTWAAPGAIGSTTANTGAFTTLSASTSLTTPLVIGTTTSLTLRPTTNAVNAVRIANATGAEILSVDTTNSRVGIGTTSPSQALDLIGSLRLEVTTTSTTGVIYKGSDRFIHNFQHPTGSTAVPVGQNTFVGINAGNFTMGSTATSTSHGSYNSAMGMSALFSNTTGFSNSVMGRAALYSNTTGNDNSAIGMNALYFNTEGNQNSAMGGYALFSNTTGNENTAMGRSALLSNTTGFGNSAMGRTALYSNTTGYYNSAMGVSALYNNTTGFYNSAMGVNAGRYIADGITGNATGSYNTFIGFNTKALADGGTNETVIGYNATGVGSNSVVLGNDSVTKTILKGNVGIGTTSPSNLLEVRGASSNIQSSVANANISSAEPGLVITKTATSGTPGDGIGSSILFQTESGNTSFPGIKNTAQILSIISWQGDASNGPKGDLVFQTGWNGNLTDKMRLDADGNLGIGTSFPTSLLSVGAFSQFQVDSSGNLAKINNLEYISWPSTHTTDGFLKNDGSGTLTWTTLADEGVIGGTGSNSQVAFWTDTIQLDGDSAFSWDNTNKWLGIGTTDPKTTLQVSGSSAVAQPTLGVASGGFYLTNTDLNYGLLSGVHTSGDAWLQVQRTDTTATAYNLNLQPSGGNVGIGTILPDYLLSVGASFGVDNSGDLKKIKGVSYSWPTANPGTGNTRYLQNDGDGGLTWAEVISGITSTGTPTGSAGGGQVTFWTGSDTISGDSGFFWDNTNKRLGIGTSTPSSALEISGASEISNVLGDIEISSHTGLLFEVDNSAITPLSAMFINSSGRVGIGTVSPAALLSVGATSQFSVNTSGNITRINNLAYNSWPSAHTTDGFLKNDGSGTLTWTEIVAVQATGTPSGTAGGGQVSFWTGSDTISGDDDLYWDNVNKRLGIGTNMPQSSLDIASAGSSGGIISNSSGDITITPAQNLIISQGDVGIGTGTPLAKLHIVGSSILLKNSADELMTFTLDSGLTSTQSTSIRFRDSSATGNELRYSFEKTNTNAFQLYDHVNVASRFLVGAGANSGITLRTIGTGSFSFINNTSTLMTILSSGNVGIGTASPAQKLHVGGNIAFGTSTISPTMSAVERQIFGNNTTATGTYYAKIYSKTNTSGADNLRFIIRSQGVSEYSAEVKIHVPQYSGYLTSTYGNAQSGNGAQVEISMGGLTTQHQALVSIIETADGDSSSPHTELWLKITTTSTGTDIFLKELAGNTAPLLLTTDNGSIVWSTTAPSNQTREFPFTQGVKYIGGGLKVDGSKIIRSVDVQVDSVSRDVGTGWTLGPTFNIVNGFKAGSLVKLTYHIPMRNNSSSWGGGYIEPQISFNGGTTWNSLGSSGYDGGVMNIGGGAIGSYFNSILVDPQMNSDYSVRVRFYYRAYDGTVLVNYSHDINSVSGTAGIMSGTNGLQHYTKVIVEELY